MIIGKEWKMSGLHSKLNSKVHYCLRCRRAMKNVRHKLLSLGSICTGK